jgi:uncharacterized protein YfcZ (UPF0381/DUF406 family)
VSVVVLPAPTVYFYYKDTHSATGTRWTNASTTAAKSDDNFQENPLSMNSGQSDAYDVEGRELPNALPAQAKLAKMQREAKDTRVQNQRMQMQILQLQTENASLKAVATTKDESTKVQALQAQNATNENTIAALKAQLAQAPQSGGAQLQLTLSDVSPGTYAPLQHAVAKTQQVAIKELASDESLSEQTRESAQLALDELAAAQVRQSKIITKKMVLPGEEMTKYLESLRLLQYADAVIRVAGTCVD